MNGLTKREDEIMRLIARGLMKKQIADKLGISMGTVKCHVEHIYDKLGVHKAISAVNAWKDDKCS